MATVLKESETQKPLKGLIPAAGGLPASTTLPAGPGFGANLHVPNITFTAGVESQPPSRLRTSPSRSIGHGDVERGFEKEDVVVEREFDTKPVHLVD